MHSSRFPVFIHRSGCELCGNGRPEILYSEDFGSGRTWNFLSEYYHHRIHRDSIRGTPFEVLRCTDCGFIWQAYVLDGPSAETLYERWISPAESRIKEQSLDCRFRVAQAQQVSMISLLCAITDASSAAVLDFGMGWGSWCLMAKAFGYQAYGAEISPSRVAAATANGIDVIEDVTKCDLEFIFINAEQTFEHLYTPLPILRGLVERLRPGGVIRISVPNGASLRKKIRRRDWTPAKDEIHPLEHVNCFTHSTLALLGHKAGLKPLPKSRMARASRDLVVRGSTSLYGFLAMLHGHLFATGIWFQKE